MSSLPSGTITFLFTDIEGSTRLWEQHPEQMRTALARHDTILREAIESNNGHVFKTVGDAFCAVFHTAPDALQTALAAQQALHAEAWPAETPLRVRMALHTGAAQERDHDYFGPPVNRVARLLSLGYGGQTLVSEVTQSLVIEGPSEGCRLLSLGEHRLRDLSHPETVFQLLHPVLPADFPPLKSLDSLPNNLPRQLTSFVGREKEIEEVKALLARTRLLTLTGSGGSGKTRLALQVAADLLDAFPEGVWVAELAPLADPTLVTQTVATALGIHEQAGQNLLQTVTDYLKSRTLLLLLDNCEHLLSACVQLAASLLRSCPQVKVLATSREALGIAGEQTYRVPSLSLPDLKQTLTVETLLQSEAVRLFTERALLVQSDFVVRPHSVVALGQLCSRLDGIPLAIELAAARVRSLSVEEINARLDSRFRLLTGGNRAALPRQQTLRALVDWSYDLLSAPERGLLCRLSVFAGGWVLEAAEAVCEGGEIEAWEVLDLLTSLVDKSLVVYEEREGAARYRLLETVRQYGMERLAQSGDAEEVRGRHRDYFLGLAEAAEPQLAGPEQGMWLARLEVEHDNLRAALSWCGAEEEGAEAGLRLAGALCRFWDVRGYLGMGRTYLGEALEREGASGRTKERAKALNGAGNLAKNQGDYEAARLLHEESLAIRRELGDTRGVAVSLHNLGFVAEQQGDYEKARALHEECLVIRRELRDKRGIAHSLLHLGNAASYQGDPAAARTLYEESLAIARELGDTWGVATSLGNMGIMAQEQGNYEAGRLLHEESLAIRREMGDKQGIAWSLGNLGFVAEQQGDYEKARTLQEESLTLFRELEDKRGIADSLHNLGNAAYYQGDYEAARGTHEESLALRREMGDKRGIAHSLHNLGNVAYCRGDYAAARTLYDESMTMRQELGDRRGITVVLEATARLKAMEGQPERAARLLATAEALREAIQAPLPPNEREQYDRVLASVREALTEEAFSTAWEEGRTMTMEQVVAYAREQKESSD